MTFANTMHSLLVGKETTQGSGTATTKDLGLVTDGNTTFSTEVQEHKNNSNITTQQVTSGLRTPTGNVSLKLQHGRPFEFIIGEASHDASDSPDIKHTFTVDDVPKSFTALSSYKKGSSEAGNKLFGCIAGNSVLSYEVNDVLRLSMDFPGLTGGTASAGTASVSDLQVFPATQISTSINGVESFEVQSCTININKNTASNGGSGTAVLQQLHATSLSFNYDITLGFTSDSYSELNLNDTTHEIIIDANNGVSAGSGKRQIYLSLENCKNSKAETPIVEDGLVYVNITGVGTLKECYSYDNITEANWF